jgi:hypothetical protein
MRNTRKGILSPRRSDREEALQYLGQKGLDSKPTNKDIELRNTRKGASLTPQKSKVNWQRSQKQTTKKPFNREPREIRETGLSHVVHLHFVRVFRVAADHRLRG